MEAKRLFKRIVTLLVLNALFGLSLFGQTSPPSVDLPTVIPPSPNAAALGKYGDIPVGAYTGIPNVAIPLYTMQVGKYSLPISLNYHSGGLKVEEIASSVGLGWSLSAGGVITRSMHGLPDESSNGYLQSYGLTVAAIEGSTVTTESICAGDIDKQPDLFYYNFAGQSGKFILDTSAQHNARFIPFANVKVTHDAALDSFQIVDANGIIYLFSTPETTNVEGGKSTPTYISSWYLTTIITHSGKINFTYATEQTLQYQRSELDYLSESPGQDCVGVPAGRQGTTASVVVDAQLLVGITSPFETITFATTPGRQDMNSASSVNSMSVTDPSGHAIKKFSFTQSYFGVTGSSNPSAVRLKLDRVDEISVLDTTQKKSYTLQYFSPQSVPSTQSFAQDFWGFYNGQTNNSTCLPYIDPLIYGSYVSNQANVYGRRQANAASAQIGVLQSIKYPTGGSSTFIYEGNDYSSSGNGLVITPTKQVTRIAGVRYFSTSSVYSDTIAFSMPTAQTATLNVNGSGLADPTKTDGYGPTVLLNRINSNGTRTLIRAFYELNSLQTSTQTMIVGNYELIASIDSDSSDGKEICSGNIVYTVTDTSMTAAILPTGGVRIKQIINTDSVGGNQTIKTFRYRSTADSTQSSGSLTSDIQIAEEKRSYANACAYWVRGSAPSNYLGATQGSHVGYSTVTEIETSGSTTNGRKESYFSSPWDIHNQLSSESAIFDFNSVGSAGFNTRYATDNDVYRGLLQKELIYNAGGTLIHSTVSNYNISYPNFYSPGSLPANYYEAPAIVGYKDYMCHWKCTSCSPTYTGEGAGVECTTYLLNNFALLSYNVVCPWIYKMTDINTSYDQNGLNALTDTLNYYYDNPIHGQMTRVVQNNSKGDSLKTVNIYPGDKSQITGLDPAAGMVLDTMVNRNMIGPVVQEEHYYNTNLVSRVRTDFAIWPGSLRNISPSKKWYQIGSNPIENRINFLAYDNRDNLLQVAKATDVNLSYIWDYLSSYPIAEVKNADTASIAYTSFEADGSGNWLISAQKIGTTGGITGNNFDTLATGATISKSGLNASRNYLVTYWSKNGPLTISGTTATSGLVKKGWTFYQHTLPASSTSVSITGAGIILDELRLYPTDAQMSTYTYTRLIGVSSNCSANNLTTYYEYDGLNRLIRIRDVDGNILKQYEYQYQVPPAIQGN